MNQLKELGNICYANGQYEHAIRKYKRGLDICGKQLPAFKAKTNITCIEEKEARSTQQQETESQTEMEAIHIALLRNCSAAYLKLQMWLDAIDTCSQALELDCDDIKALSRRGQAYEQLGEVKPII